MVLHLRFTLRRIDLKSENGFRDLFKRGSWLDILHPGRLVSWLSCPLWFDNFDLKTLAKHTTIKRKNPLLPQTPFCINAKVRGVFSALQSEVVFNVLVPQGSATVPANDDLFF